ncbi:exonuclease domain-containing protein [Hydrogenobacter sp. T-2]|uniref:3'-5' exonuclease n=1 Tax=Pampinifervens diazotrophicum TaxID=1632018 RepID=UPI002B25CB76|nr:exonuclease domain-containing protein [Hydrogenobacter sp. T-2]WPM32247.1 exonuclease domain-containing protein [Hydrogenobacter sp. T-2]
MIRALIDKLLGSREELSWEVNKETKIEDLCFVVFDTETTGLDLKKDEALGIGAVKIENLRIDLSKNFYALLKPTKEYNESIKVHGITPEDLRSARERKEICMEFLEYAKGYILAGYFLQIDIAMLKRLIKEECGFSLKAYALDLLDLVEHKGKVPTLEELLKIFKLPISTQHNALEDAYMTALLLLRLLKDGNYKKLKDLPVRRF